MRETGLVLLALTMAGCAPSRPTSREPAERTVARVDTTAGPVALGGRDLSEVERAIENAPRAAELRATSDTVRLRVGEVAASGTLPLTMRDAAGEPLGRLPLYDLRVGPEGVVEIKGMGVRGARAGVQSVRVAIPDAFRGGREGPAPSAVLHFVVRD